MVVPHSKQSYQTEGAGGSRAPDPFEVFERVAEALRPAFSRTASADWFSAASLGIASRHDDLGMASVMRALRLEPKAYNSLLGCMRSDAWEPRDVIRLWQGAVPGLVPILERNGRAVMPIDGCKVAKEGGRMPGVKRLKQDSEDTSKAPYIFGHMTGAVGVLAGEPGACECVPLAVGIHDGMRAAAAWEGALGLGVLDEPHTLQCARMAHEAAWGMGRDAYAVMDRYFMCRNVLGTLDTLNAASRIGGVGGPTVELVTRCRRGATTCYLEPPPREPHRPGRPPLKGAAVRPFEVIEELLGPSPARKGKGKGDAEADAKAKGDADGAVIDAKAAPDTVASEGDADAKAKAKDDADADAGEDGKGKGKRRRKKLGTATAYADGRHWEFEEVTASVRGVERRYMALTLDLLWGEGLYRKLRFVLARDDEGRDIVLVTTDLTLTAAQVIELYSLRWPCEPMFRTMKQDTMGFGYRFWSKACPPLDRRSGKDHPDRLEAVEDPHDRGLVLGAYGAIARYLALSCVTAGTLQAIALGQPDDGPVACHEFQRTRTEGKVSVATVRSSLREGVSDFILSGAESTMATFIRGHRVGDGGYAPSAAGKERG